MNLTELLTEFREHHSEDAFAALMRRYSGLVFSVAYRRLSDRSLAEECTQEVFVRLVPELVWIQDEPTLVRWLHATAHRTAIDRWRKESRRRDREQKAIDSMHFAPEPRDPSWLQLAPLLDDALQKLEPADQQAVLLRYFQSQPLRAVGAALGLSEEAAKMRVRRALGRLHRILGRQGITCSVVTLALLLQENAVEAQVPPLTHFLNPAQVLAQAANAGSGFSFLHGAWLLMKTKLAVVLVAVLLGWWWWHRDGSSTRRAQASVDPTARRVPGTFVPRSLSTRNIGPGSNAVAPTPADPLVRLEEVLRSARRIRQDPPASLVEALRQCSDAPTQAVAILQRSLASPDYETRHWAFEGLKVVLQLRELEAGREAARQALAQVAVTIDNPDHVGALMSLFALPVPVDSTTPSREPISPEVLRILTEGFRSTDTETLVGQLLVADLLNARLKASGQDFSGYEQMLVGLLSSANPQQSIAAAYALAGFSKELSEPAFEILNRSLSEDSPGISRVKIAEALGRLGADAQEAVPALEQMLASYPANDPLRLVIKKALHAIESDAAGTPAGSSTPDSSHGVAGSGSGIGSMKQQFHQSLVEPVLATLADPELRRQFDEEAWFARVTFPYDAAARDALEDAAAASDPETAALLRRLKERVSTDLPEEQDYPLDEALPSRKELLVVAQGVNELQGLNMSPETMARVQDLARKYGVRSGGSDTATLANFRQMATDLRQIDPRLYAATRKSFLETYPWLDRVLP